MLELTWEQMKGFISSRSVPLQWVDMGVRYWIGAFDGPLHVYTYIHKDAEPTYQVEFETTYKPTSNKSPTPTMSSFSSKTFADKKLYARNCGVQQALAVGANTISYIVPYPWVKMIGVEVINSEALDYVNFRIKDSATGSYSGVPNTTLNQFAFNHNLPKDYYLRTAAFDADLYQGMVIEVTYTSISAKTVGINYLINEVKA